MVSPERLGNDHFRRETLQAIRKGIGLFVVDEAHCISDWGHDFRPDYRRVVQIVRQLPTTVPVLATTATANNRVVADIESQIGSGLMTIRGSLTRPSLRLQTIRLGDQAERLAWLAQYLPTLPGSGIVYCLTVADCEQVSGWLIRHGIDAPAYHANLQPVERRARLEERLLRNEVKALISTVALGMGFDKPDLGFVVHYQRPGSVVAYYQQIGRAGRAVVDAYAILLSGREDDDIADYFIRSAFPSLDELRQIVETLENAEGLTIKELLSFVNVSSGRTERALKLLELDGVVSRDGTQYGRTVNPWRPDEARTRQVTELRYHELARMREYVEATSCLMEFVARELDNPTARPCRRCAVCAGEIVPAAVDPVLVQEGMSFLRRTEHDIEPRRMLPAGVFPERPRKIEATLLNRSGRALCVYGDAGWGRLVRTGKYDHRHFDDELLEAAAELISHRWHPDPFPTWVTSVPSLREPVLVPDFAQRLAATLGLPYGAALRKVRETPPQKTMQNSAQQLSNIASAVLTTSDVQPGPVLLVDDVVDSRWTLTVCGARLRRAGSGPVHPFALARMAGGGLG